MPEDSLGGDRRAARDAPKRRLTLPNRMEIACQTLSEARFFYEDIFVKRIYHRHGIRLEDVECVFDVGANIGLFTLFVRRYCPRAVVYAFEPAPPLFACLRHNTAEYGELVRPFLCGVADRRGTADFTFYPTSSGMSSLYADPEEEGEVLEAIFRNQERQGEPGMEEILQHSDDLMAERLRTETFNVELRTLSEILRDEQVERVDLLKIDVQKAEADVIAGIAPADWPKFRQVVIEVHDIDARVARLERQLRRQGFEVVAEQDDHYEASKMFNLYAVRPPSEHRDEARRGAAKMGRARDRAARLRAARDAQKRAKIDKESVI